MTFNEKLVALQNLFARLAETAEMEVGKPGVMESDWNTFTFLALGSPWVGGGHPVLQLSVTFDSPELDNLDWPTLEGLMNGRWSLAFNIAQETV